MSTKNSNGNGASGASAATINPVNGEKLLHEDATPLETPVHDSAPFGVESLVGKDYTDVVKGLKALSEYKDHSNLKVSNVIVAEQGKSMRISIVVATRLPQYLVVDDSVDYVPATTNTIFTTPVQVAAILKQVGEAVLADSILANPSFAKTILEGARVSAFGRDFAAGETEVNPFSAKGSEYEFEHDTVRYYLYDIVLGKTALMLKDKMLELQARAALGLL